MPIKMLTLFHTSLYTSFSLSIHSNQCRECSIEFGGYHCDICNLWMSASESPYHCRDCGFCRVGGRENFRHCHDCGMCIDTKLFNDHNCKEGKYYSNCPVCQEDLFSSRHASHEMPCGHAIHWHCFKELTSFDTRCPVCKKTAETPEQMEPTWSAIAMGIALQPVPAELARVVNIACNDCEKKDYERRWHFLGVRCMHCQSFNTQVEQILLQGLEAADFLDRQEADPQVQVEGASPGDGMME
jgi:RING finger/CHY zinc finger protein 1